MAKPTRPSVPKAPSQGENLTEFAMALYRLVETVRAEHEEAAASVGLTAAQASILAVLAQPRSMRELAEHMGCDASNITGLVDRLEAKALVVRTADPGDRRVKRISHTAAGKAAVQRFQRELVRVSSLAELAPAARSALLTALDQVRRPK